MEYLVFFVTIGLILAVLAAKGAWDTYKIQKKFTEHLYKDYGKLPDREYKVERLIRIDGYYRKHPKDGQIDDITWNDLNMDEIFKRMNYTLSSTGEEYLYYTLRTPKMSQADIDELEEKIAFFENHADERVKVQLLMHRLGVTGNYSLYDYLEYLGVLGERSNRKILLCDLLILILIGICFVNLSVGLMGIAVLVVYNIVTYFKEKEKIEPYIISFSYVMRLLDVCDRLLKLPLPACRKNLDEVRLRKGRLGKMRQGAGLVLKGSSATGSGNPLDILMDYFNMAFHVDIMFFNRMVNQLNLHLEDVDALITQLGILETAICIGQYRASSQNGWCRPAFLTKGKISLKAEAAYHPLIDQPVKNSIVTERGLLLTGSNASGKSTFLKTMAVNAILAQTINTCNADTYQAPFFRICSSMALRDDMESGESYYIVEIKALKRILSNTGDQPLLCFVDEVLRGTNTVERIAASTQILKSLGTEKVLCFAATHDIELTELLKDDYDNYHFEEEIKDGDIVFPYKLLKGKATTRNAIRLLEIMGYDESIIEKATRQAEHFMASGVWELP